MVGHALTIENKGFFDGIRRNTSIETLELHCAGASIVDENVSRFERMAYEILTSYQENNNLTQLDLHLASIRSDESRDFFCHILKRYTNLTSVTLHFCYFVTSGRMTTMAMDVRHLPQYLKIQIVTYDIFLSLTIILILRMTIK